MPFSDVGPEADYLKAKQAVQLLKAERDTLSQGSAPQASENHQAQRRDREAGKPDQTLPRRTRSKNSRRAANPSANRWRTCRRNIKEWESQSARSEPAARAVQSRQRQSRSAENTLRSADEQPEGSQRFASASIAAIRFRSWKWRRPPISVRPGLLKSLLIGFGLRRACRHRHPAPARSDRRSHGLLRRIPASFLRERSRPNPEGKNEGQSHSASAGRCAAHLRRIVSQHPLVHFLHAV